MSILIKGMKVPETCWDCFVDNALAQNIAYFEAICPFTERFVTFADFDAMSGRHPECPLVEVPPHGRLVDGDGLLAFFNDAAMSTGIMGEVVLGGVCETIAAVPTVIEAEEGEKHD